MFSSSSPLSSMYLVYCLGDPNQFRNINFIHAQSCLTARKLLVRKALKL
jgi:hypothetical protein